MGAIIAVISDKLSNKGHKGDVNTFINNNEKHRSEHKELKDPCESDREIKQNAIIREIQLMENCTSCYLEERVRTLLTPWVTKSFPWDQSTEPINEIISEGKGNSPGSSKTIESNTKSQFTCHHFTLLHTCKSLYHRNSYSATESCN